MKAAVIRRRGFMDKFKVKEVLPPFPRKGEAFIRVRAAGVNPIDWKLGKIGFIWAAFKTTPLIIGYDIAGEIVDLGRNTEGFKPGDRVFTMLESMRPGAYAEFAAAKVKYIARIPDQISYEQAAASPLAGLTAIKALVKIGRIQNGMKVMINGASGGVGTFAIQLAKAYGAEVTAICSGKNEELVRSLGADDIIDYTKDDPEDLTRQFDIVFDTVGNLSFRKIKFMLYENGVLVSTLPNLKSILGRIFSFAPQRYRTFITSVSEEGMSTLALMLGENKIIPVVDRVFPLEDISVAHKYSESKRTTGKIIIKVD
jgi:NADPH:quinone reductase-like Zn-dependent oxidoreductase